MLLGTSWLKRRGYFGQVFAGEVFSFSLLALMVDGVVVGSWWTRNVACRIFFFNDTATTEIYTLSLHDALPISRCLPIRLAAAQTTPQAARSAGISRSEEHTSELQSRVDFVCRLLLEKKKSIIASGLGSRHWRKILGVASCYNRR